MDKFIEGLASIVKPPWNYLLGIVGLLIVVAPRVIELHHNWLDLRLGRAQLEREKLRLEILKLRMDVGLSQEQPVPGFAHALEAVTAPRPSVTTPPAPPAEQRGPLRRFAATYPRFGGGAMLVAQVILAYLLAIFAIAAVVFPFLGWTEAEIGFGPSLLVATIYAALAWLSYKGFVVTRSIRKELAAR